MRPLRLSRRALLRGAGVAAGLPLLEAMLDSRGRLLGNLFVGDAAAGTTIPPAFVIFGFPNGVDNSQFVPAEVGAAWRPTAPLAPLDRHRADLVVMSGVRKSEGLLGQEYDTDPHSRGHGTYATGYGITARGVGGPSLERALADELWRESTALKSLTVGLGAADFFRGNMSWAAESSPVAPFQDPRTLYAYLYADDTGSDALAPGRAGVVDLVAEDAGRLSARLGGADCQRVEEYLDALRELEVRMAAPPLACKPGAEPDEWDEQDKSDEKADVLAELLLTALSCGMTRYGFFQLCNRWDQRQFPWLGIENLTDGHHAISHDVSDAGRADFETICIDQMEQFARLLDAAKARIGPLGDSLFDEALFFTAAEMGSIPGDYHYYLDIPLVLAAGRRVPLGSKGRHLVLDRPVEYGEVLLTAARLCGSQRPSFGLHGHRSVRELIAG